jgi:hypothetical protein
MIRVGGTQTAAFVAGISGSLVTGDAVMVNSAGKLGMVMSSARYKRDIQEMGNGSQRLLGLRPVTFRYKDDPRSQRHYGLIAEEVARIYPDLVGYGPGGTVETVRYHELIPMLLNELQKRTRENEQQAERINQLSAQIAEISAKLSALEQAMRGGNRTVADASPALRARMSKPN